MDEAFAFGAGDHGFDSRAGQIGHSVANCSPPLRPIAETLSRGDGPRQPQIVTRIGVIRDNKKMIFENEVYLTLQGHEQRCSKLDYRPQPL